MTGKRRVSIALSVIAIAAVCTYPVWPPPYSEAYSIGKNARDFKELSNRFDNLSREKGAEYAFEVLRIAELPANTDLHLLGHVVGDALYEQRGVQGIAVCTQDFRNACSHSVVIGALNEFGSSALPMIRDACTQAPGGPGAYTMCFHGLGHGVFAYHRYSLPETIDFCKTTGTEAYNNREYVECVGGSIMELVGGGGHDPDAWIESRLKYLSTTEPTALCMGSLIPTDAQEICITYLTPHLFELAGVNLGRPDPQYFSKAFAYCDAIPTDKKNMRTACFGGFGKEFIPMAGNRDIRSVDAFSDEQFARALSWCRLSPIAEGVYACVGEAVASVFWGGENDPEGAFRFCALTQGPESHACYMRLAGDVQSYTDGERRTTLCARVPSEYQYICK